jgi:hypothetical protein
MRRFRVLMMARTQLPNLALPRSPEDGLAGSGSAFDKQFMAGTRAVGIAGEGQDFGVMRKSVDHGCSDNIVGRQILPLVEWDVADLVDDDQDDQFVSADLFNSVSNRLA